MKQKNPGTVLLLDEKIDFQKIVSNLKKEWDFECNYEVTKESKFTNYSFSYDNVDFCLSEFDSCYPEDLTDDIEDNGYGEEEELKEIYQNHDKFWIVAVIGDAEEDLNKVYSLFTRVVMSMLYVCEEALVYDTRTGLVIKSDIYLSMYPQMKKAFEAQQYFFPIDWYINIQIYEDEDGLSAVSQGFDVFNDYEIEIHNKPMEYEELYKIMKFIITNVVSRQDKISNGDVIPVPVDQDYEQAIVKQFQSEVLDEEALAFIF